MLGFGPIGNLPLDTLPRQVVVQELNGLECCFRHYVQMAVLEGVSTLCHDLGNVYIQQVVAMDGDTMVVNSEPVIVAIAQADNSYLQVRVEETVYVGCDSCE